LRNSQFDHISLIIETQEKKIVRQIIRNYKMSSLPIDFFGKPEDQAAVMVVGHSIFLLFNVINVAYLVLVQWFALGKLKGSSVLKLMLAGCLLQQFSCIPSIVRWNTQDPYGIWGYPSACFSVFSRVPIDIAMLYVCFNKDYKSVLKTGTIIWVLFGIILAVLSIKNWDGTSKSFSVAMMYGPIDSLYRLVSAWRLRNAHGEGHVSNSDPTVSPQQMGNIIILYMILEGVTFIVEAGVVGTLFKIAVSGVHFSAALLLMLYVDKMDFISATSTTEGGGDVGRPKYESVRIDC